MTLHDNKPAAGSPKLSTSFHRASGDRLSLFCYQLALVFKSGISPVEGIPLLIDEQDNEAMNRILKAVAADLQEGLPLHLALSRHPIFPPYMLEMVSIGEATGTLDKVMENLSTYYEREDRLKQKVRRAVVYPLVLAAMMAGIILLLVIKILPMFNEVLESIGGQLPASTRFLMASGHFLQDNALAAGLLLMCLLLLVLLLPRSQKGKKWLDRFMTESGLTGWMYRKITAARFGMTLSLLLNSGIALEQALGMVRNVMGNRYVSEKLEGCREKINQGEDPYRVFAATGIFPRLFVRMLGMGYQTGRLDEMLAKISQHYEAEVDQTLQRATAAIEPLLVIILSVVVGVILLSVMLPLINIMSTIG